MLVLSLINLYDFESLKFSYTKTLLQKSKHQIFITLKESI